MAILLPREVDFFSRMNRSATGWSVKRFERSNRLDTALYKNIPFIDSRHQGRCQNERQRSTDFQYSATYSAERYGWINRQAIWRCLHRFVPWDDETRQINRSELPVHKSHKVHRGRYKQTTMNYTPSTRRGCWHIMQICTRGCILWYRSSPTKSQIPEKLCTKCIPN